MIGYAHPDTGLVRQAPVRCNPEQNVAELKRGAVAAHFGEAGVPAKWWLQLDGASLVGHPHDPTLHPAIFLTYIFGPFLGLKLEILLLWLASVVGTWLLLSRGLGLTRWAAAYVSAIVASLTWTSQHVFGGDIPELQYLLTPLLLYLFLEGRRSRAAVVGAAVLLATIASVSAYRVVLIAAIPLLYLPLQTLLEGRPTEAGPSRTQRLRRDLQVLFVGNLAALGIAAPKLLPALWTISTDSTRGARSFSQTFFTLSELTSRLVEAPGRHLELFEWSHYVGWSALLLAGVGLTMGRRALPAGMVALGAGVICLGDNLPINFFALLQKPRLSFP